MRRGEVSAAQWMEQIRLQPENVARLLEFETRWGELRADEYGQVWHGRGTSFKLMPTSTQQEDGT